MSHPAAVATLFFVGFLFHDRTTWGIAIMLTGFSMIVNPALKEFFQLARPLGAEGYGFPSGHFQSSVVFYGWVAYMWPNRFIRALIAFFLIGIGFGLVYLGFHYVRDLMGSFVVGGIILLITAGFLRMQPFKDKPPTYGFLLLAVSGIPLLYLYLGEGVPKHAWEGLACLTLSTVLWTVAFPYFKKRESY